MHIRAIIIDDDPIIQHLVQGFIDQNEDIELIDSYTSPEDAIKDGKLGDANLIFLDMEMPGMTGKEFIDGNEINAYLVMMTAHANYAHFGFEKDVVDFLLKPFDQNRFNEAIEKIKRRIVADKHTNHHLYIKKGKEFVKIDFDDILYIQSAQEYVHIYTPAERLITYSNMKDILSRLDDRFMQIHRSNIINLEKVDTYDRNKVKINGHEINVSRAHASELQNQIKMNT